MRNPKEVAEDAILEINYRLGRRNREEDAKTEYDGFNKIADNLRAAGKIKRGKQVSADAPSIKGFASIIQQEGMYYGEQQIQYFRHGKNGRIEESVMIAHRQDNVSETETTEVTANNKKPNSGASLGTSRRERQRMQNARLASHRI